MHWNLIVFPYRDLATLLNRITSMNIETLVSSIFFFHTRQAGMQPTHLHHCMLLGEVVFIDTSDA